MSLSGTLSLALENELVSDILRASHDVGPAAIRLAGFDLQVLYRIFDTSSSGQMNLCALRLRLNACTSEVVEIVLQIRYFLDWGKLSAMRSSPEPHLRGY